MSDWLPPGDVIEAARKVSDWFAERNVKEWKLGGTERRRYGEDWISVKDRLPEVGMFVLIVDGATRQMAVAAYQGVEGRPPEWPGSWSAEGSTQGDYDYAGGPISAFSPTHWMPLPPPPQEAK